MHSKRLGVGVVVVNRLLYAIGGFDGNERLASVECYHPENNEWSYLPPLKTGRSGAGVAAIDQFIYVVGGFDGTRQLATVERYDTENETWDMVAPIQIARSALSLTPLDGKLYAIGGFDGNNFLSIVEVYDPRTNTWEQGTPLNSGRSGHASAVIYQPSCASSFMDYEESEMPKPDGSNGEMQSEAARDPCGSLNQTFCGGASNMQFHASYGSNGCNNCDSDIAVKVENPTEFQGKTVKWERITDTGRFRKIQSTDQDSGDPDSNSFCTPHPQISTSKLKELPNSISTTNNKLALNQSNAKRRCLLVPVCTAMQNVIHKSIEWRHKMCTS
ncbi:hypothetical protein ACLKA6_014975 [Drosophila palustris]